MPESKKAVKVVTRNAAFLHKVGAKNRFVRLLTRFVISLQSAFVSTTLTVRIAKKDVPLQEFDRAVNLSYTNGETYKMLLGQPVDKDGNVLDIPQNIILYDTESGVADGNVSGEYDSKEEKATLTVSKTDEDGKKLSGVEFTLYKVDGNETNLVKTLTTNAHGIAEWVNLAVSLVAKAGSVAPHVPTSISNAASRA